MTLCMTLFLSASFANAQAQPDGERSLGDIAKEFREQRRVTVRTADPSGTTAVAATVPDDYFDAEETDQEVESYLEKIARMLANQDYDSLEAEANEVRSTKARFPGGDWRLYSFYDAVKAPSGRVNASDNQWHIRIEALRRWVAQKPESPTARIALASAYLLYAWKGRSEAADYLVTDLQWQTFHERSELARKTFEEAATLPTQCPYWYAMMVNLAKAQGWSRERTRKLVEESYARYPDFHHTYNQYAYYLQKKWFGNQGDEPAFADDISARLGGREGEFVYFEIASYAGCGKCSGKDHELDAFSWLRLKSGYAAMQHMYGNSTLKLNRFAVMAFRFHDEAVGKPILQRIGSQWDQRAWSSEKEFDLARRWAAAD